MSIDLKEFVEDEKSCSEIEQDSRQCLHVEKGDVVTSPDVSPTSTANLPSPPPRNGWKPPCYNVQQEKFEHRVIAHLKAEGRTNVEIAAITGLTNTTINYIVKQPWVEPLVLELIHQRGGDRVERFLEDLVLPALETIKDVMQDEDATRRDKLKAAEMVLNRKYGNPTQPFTITDKRTEAKDLTDDELARIARTGSTGTTPPPVG